MKRYLNNNTCEVKLIFITSSNRLLSYSSKDFPGSMLGRKIIISIFPSSSMFDSEKALMDKIEPKSSFLYFILEYSDLGLLSLKVATILSPFL